MSDEEEEIGLNKEDSVPAEPSDDLSNEESKSVNPEDKDEAMASDNEKEEQ